MITAILQWYRRRDCGVNSFSGGKTFVCHRQLSPKGNGAFCSFHGESHNAKMSLTWPAWFRAQFIYRPRNVIRSLRERYFDLKLWWETRRNPLCDIKGCKRHSVTSETIPEEYGGDGVLRNVCLDHVGP